jgi:hypothetical protein
MVDKPPEKDAASYPIVGRWDNWQWQATPDLLSSAVLNNTGRPSLGASSIGFQLIIAVPSLAGGIPMGPKLPKAPSPSRVKSALRALRALINRPGTQPEAVDYFQEVLTGFGGMGVGAGGNRNDRGAAILLATNLENSLRIAIERKLAIDAKHRTMLFEEEASPLRDFSAKIRMGYAVAECIRACA